MKQPSRLLTCMGVPVLMLAAGVDVLAAQENSGDRDRRFLEYAIQAGNWIESCRQDEGDQTVWPVSPGDSPSGEFNLYSGSSGIVLFWLQLHRATGDEKYLELARRGANALLSHVAKLDGESDPGYWTGYSGVAATLAEFWMATQETKHLEGYRRCFELLAARAKPMENSRRNGVQFNSVTDIIAGSAGIGFFLLFADNFQDDERALKLAVQVGDGLLDVAETIGIGDGVSGLRWMMDPDFPREMPNYSHGTAGICDFLLALDARLIEKSGQENARGYDRRFLKAVEAGARYLVFIANEDNGNWLIVHHRSTKATGTNEEPLYYLGWCHGPTGTGRLFLSLGSSLPEQEQWKAIAVRNGTSLMGSGIPVERLPGFWNNVGVCCGSSGVGAFALDLYQVTADPALKEFSTRLAMDTWERGTKHDLENGQTGLSWTHAEHRSRPDFVQAQTGLMQGAAGIGLWFLELDAFLNGGEFGFSIPVQPIQGKKLRAR